MIYFSFMKRFHKLSMLGISLLLLNMSNTVLAQRKLVPLDEQAPAETPSSPSSSFDKNDRWRYGGNFSAGFSNGG
jgi:hypothetical protein